MQAELPNQNIGQWAAIIGTTVTIIAAIVGVAVVYLKLFIRSSLSDHESKMLEHIDEKFALKELMEEKFKSLEVNLGIRLGSMEKRLDALERRT